MAYRTYFRSVLNDNFKILTWLLILFIAITPNFIFMQSARAANVGGWNLSNPVAQGASTVYDATKNVLINGKDFIKNSSVKITPTASQVAKVLRGGAAGYALSVAVEQLLGAVDWVLDPANNQIRYQDPDASNSCTTTNGCGALDYYLFRRTPTVYTYYTSVNPACSAVASSFGQTLVRVEKFYDSQGRVNGAMCHTKTSTGSSDRWGLDVITNPVYDPNANDEEREKTLPLDVVAAQVISNAESDTDKRAAAQVATTAAAADIVAEAETDNTKARPIANQAEANAETKPADADAAASANTGAATATPQADPVTGEQAPPTDIALEFPVFCNWAPIVCEAAQTAVNFMSDYEPDPESGEVTVYQDNNIIFDDSQRVNFSSSCPSPEQFSVSFFGATQNLEFSYQPLCNFMSMIKPFVVAGSYVIGAYIVMGLSRGSAE